jgi:NAD+ kinase
MQNIGLVLKRSEEKALKLGKEITDYIQKTGRRVILENSCADLVSEWKASLSQNLSDEADLLVVLGGDGAMLKAAHLMNCKSTPILGVNLGRVGYMTEIAPEEAITELDAALEGKSVQVERMMLQVELPDGTKVRALNEMVIHWGKTARLMDLDISFGNAAPLEVRADGLIVATPIGSTAYSFAASGPLVHPGMDGILITPICPYGGLKRSLVIPPEMRVDLKIRKGEEPTLTLDGHSTYNLEIGQKIAITKAELRFVMVQSRVRDYFDILKQKLGFV